MTDTPPADPPEPPRGDGAGGGSPAEPVTVHDLYQGLLGLGRTVTELAAVVEQLQAAKAAAAAPWWDTDALTPCDAARLRGTVIAFGEYLRATYAITALPHRWDQDPALLAELTALYVGWIGAYHEPRASTSQPLQWHEALHRTLDRIQHYQDRRRQRDSVNGHTAQTRPELPVAFVPQPVGRD